MYKLHELFTWTIWWSFQIWSHLFWKKKCFSVTVSGPVQVLDVIDMNIKKWKDFFQKVNDLLLVGQFLAIFGQFYPKCFLNWQNFVIFIHLIHIMTDQLINYEKITEHFIDITVNAWPNNPHPLEAFDHCLVTSG